MLLFVRLPEINKYNYVFIVYYCITGRCAKLNGNTNVILKLHLILKFQKAQTIVDLLMSVYMIFIWNAAHQVTFNKSTFARSTRTNRSSGLGIVSRLELASYKYVDYVLFAESFDLKKKNDLAPGG